MEPQDRTVAQLLEELHVMIPFGVETGRMPTTAAPALEARLPGEDGELARSRKYFARSGTAQLAITREQLTALRRGGAPGDDVQVIRSFKNAENVTFSDHCLGCQRWIHLGGAEREDQCFCGQIYRVAFDLTPEDWSTRHVLYGLRCRPDDVSRDRRAEAMARNQRTSSSVRRVRSDTSHPASRGIATETHAEMTVLAVIPA